MTHYYKLKHDAPKLFVFAHCDSEDIDLTEYSAASNDELQAILKDMVGTERCEISTYTQAQAQELCESEQGWFVCLDKYVEEVN